MEEEIQAKESALDLIKMTLRLNPGNKGLTDMELHKIALKELEDSMDD